MNKKKTGVLLWSRTERKSWTIIYIAVENVGKSRRAPIGSPITRDKKTRRHHTKKTAGKTGL